jgi:hypothetical protein
MPRYYSVPSWTIRTLLLRVERKRARSAHETTTLAVLMFG